MAVPSGSASTSSWVSRSVNSASTNWLARRARSIISSHSSRVSSASFRGGVWRGSPAPAMFSTPRVRGPPVASPPPTIRGGLEPPTIRLTGGRSTTELPDRGCPVFRHRTGPLRLQSTDGTRLCVLLPIGLGMDAPGVEPGSAVAFLHGLYVRSPLLWHLHAPRRGLRFACPAGPAQCWVHHSGFSTPCRYLPEGGVAAERGHLLGGPRQVQIAGCWVAPVYERGLLGTLLRDPAPRRSRFAP